MWKWSIWIAVIGSSKKSRKKQTKRFQNGWNIRMPPSTAGVDRDLGRVVAGESGRRMIIGGCEDIEEQCVGRS